MKKDDEESSVMKDGEKITVSMVMMDSLQAAITSSVPSGQLDESSEEGSREDLYQQYCQRVSNAWKDPSIATAATPHVPSTVKTPDPYQTYEARLQNQWRSGK